MANPGCGTSLYDPRRCCF